MHLVRLSASRRSTAAAARLLLQPFLLSVAVSHSCSMKFTPTMRMSWEFNCRLPPCLPAAGAGGTPRACSLRWRIKVECDCCHTCASVNMAYMFWTAPEPPQPRIQKSPTAPSATNTTFPAALPGWCGVSAPHRAAVRRCGTRAGGHSAAYLTSGAFCFRKERQRKQRDDWPHNSLTLHVHGLALRCPIPAGPLEVQGGKRAPRPVSIEVRH